MMNITDQLIWLRKIRKSDVHWLVEEYLFKVKRKNTEARSFSIAFIVEFVQIFAQRLTLVIQRQLPIGVLRKRYTVNMRKLTGENSCWSVISLWFSCESHFGKGVVLQVCCIFSENLFLRTPMDGYFGWYFSVPIDN